MEKREGILWVLVVVSLVLGVYCLTNINASEKKSAVVLNKTGYVNVTKVFNAFDMKNELQKKLENELMNNKNRIDSLLLQLKSLQKSLKSSGNPTEQEIKGYQNFKDYYYSEKQKFENFSLELTSKYDGQILDQMSQYIKDYGFNNGYDYIFGATGNGSILYGDQLGDLSDEIIVFINNSYQGKN